MIPIKIQCECGQKYAFEIEPVGGRMPSPVACPTCGADGTAAANAIIAQSVPVQPILVATRVATPAPTAPPAAPAAPVAPARPAPTLRIAAPAQPAQPAEPAQSAQPAMLAASAVRAAPRRPARLPGQVDRTQAEIEARAKISWGDSPKDVTVYLMMQGFTREEASELVNELFQERAKQVRAGGIRKIFYGIGLVLLPLVNVVIFLVSGVVITGVLGATVIAAFYGVYCIFKGTFMVLAPKSEPGDVASQ